MPEFTLTTIHKTDEIEIIHLFKSEDLKNKFVKGIDKTEKIDRIDLEKTVKEFPVLRQTKSIGVHLHLIFWGKYESRTKRKD